MLNKESRTLSILFISILLVGIKCDEFDYIADILNAEDKTIVDSGRSVPKNATPNFFPQFEESTEMGCGFGYSPNVANLAEELKDSEAQFGHYAWVVGIAAGQSSNAIGTGALLAPDIVLTSVNLLSSYSARDLTVFAGEWDVKSQTESIPHQSRQVETIIKHEKFKHGLQNDIALLVLSMRFSSQPNIQTICLPPPGTVYDNSKCTTIAWKPTKSSRPIRTDFIVQSRSRCNQILEEQYLNSKNEMPQDHLCAINTDKKKSAIVNLGAALFCPMRANPRRYIQVAIVIAKTNRDPERETLIFVNVSHFMPWIFQKLGPLNVDLKYYLP